MIGQKGFLELRARLYRLLASPFHTESTVTYLEELQKHLRVFSVMAEEVGVETLSEGAEKLKAYFGENPVTDGLINAHGLIFARLFLGVTARESSLKTITAQESPYLSPSGLIMQEPRDEVLELMAEEHLGLSADFKEPEDHISAEFHFMSVLSLRLAQALDAGNDAVRSNIAAQQEMLDKHLSKWVPLLCRDIISEAGTLADSVTGVYFAGVARLAQGFVEYDQLYINELAQAVN